MATRPPWTVPLPMDPDLTQLRRQARELQRGARAGDPSAVGLLTLHGGSEDPSTLTLSAAQRALARTHGFPSWPRLVHHLELVGHYRRTPDEVDDSADPADEFLRLACLTYGDDGPQRFRRAATMLAGDPSLGTAGVYAAAATADPTSLAGWLAADPALAVSEGGPYAWAPLTYLAYARHDPAVSAERVLACVDLLLGAGADPDTGYLWHGLPTPFTVLTGAFGHGEGGPVRQPAHPQALVLARRLLEAGADPNDGQALYHRMFEPDDSHLELLLAFGLGRGDGGPWKRRLGSQLPTPEELLRAQLRWAVDHAMTARVRLLARYGVDVRAPFDRPGYGERASVPGTPAEQAARRGDAEMVEVLVELGADRPTLGALDSLVAAVLRGDEAGVDALLSGDAGLGAEARAARPALVVQAAAAGSVAAVRLAARVGFDVDALGRSDIGSDQEWETGLHAAVSGDHADVVGALLELGADPAVRDRRFESTPRGWAEHLDRPAIASLLPDD